MAEIDKIIIDVELRQGESKKRVDELAAAVESLKVRRRALQKAQKEAIKTFGAESVQAQKAAAAINENKVKTTELNREIRILNREVSAGAGSLNAQRASLSKLNLQYDRFRIGIDGSEKDLKLLGKEILTLTNNIKKQEASTGRFQRNVGNYGGALKEAFTTAIPSAALLTGGIAALTVGIQGLVSGATEVITVYKDFERQLLQLKAISGASSEEFNSLEADAKRLGGTTEFTASQVALLQTNFAKLGFDPTEILAATEATLDLATATGEDLAKAAEVAGATVRAFNLETTETGRVVDVMAASFSGSALDLEKFSVSMRQVAPVAASLGFSPEDTTALLGTLANAGFDASQAGTSLRNIFLQLADPAGGLSQALGRNITSAEQLAPALKELQASGIDVAGALELTDKRSVAAFSRFLSGSDDALELSRSLEAASGQAAKMSSIIRDSLSGDIDTMNSSIEAAQISLGEALAPAMRVVVQAITAFVRGISSVVIAIRELPAFIDENKVSIVALGSAMLAFNAQAIAAAANQIRLAAIQKGAVIATRAQAVATRLLNVAMNANPIGLIITGTGLLIAAFATLYNRSQTLRAGLSGFFESIKQVGSNIIGGLVDQFVGLKEILAGIFTLDLDRIQAGAEKAFDGIKKQYLGFGDGAADAFNKGYQDRIESEEITKALKPEDIKKAEADGKKIGETFGGGFAKAKKKAEDRALESSKQAIKAEDEAKKEAEAARIARKAEILLKEQEIENEFLQKKLDAIKALNAGDLERDAFKEKLFEAQKKRLEDELQLLIETGEESIAKEIELEQLKQAQLKEIEDQKAEGEKERIQATLDAEKKASEERIAIIEAEKQAEQARIDLNKTKREAITAASAIIVKAFGEESKAGKAAIIIQKAVAAAEVGIALQKELAAISVASAAISASAPPATIPIGAAYGTAKRTAAIIKTGISLAQIAAFKDGGLTYDGKPVYQTQTFSRGGSVNRPTLGLIGEAGPEYVISNQNLRIPQVAAMVNALEGRQAIKPFADGGFSSTVINNQALNIDIGSQIQEGFNNMPRQVLVVQDVDAAQGQAIDVINEGSF